MEKYMEKSMKTGSKTDIMARGRRGKGKNQAKRFLLAVVAVALLCWQQITWLGRGGVLLLCGAGGGLLAGLLGGRRRKRKRRPVRRGRKA